jgi:hypothetical protein
MQQRRSRKNRRDKCMFRHYVINIILACLMPVPQPVARSADPDRLPRDAPAPVSHLHPMVHHVSSPPRPHISAASRLTSAPSHSPCQHLQGRRRRNAFRFTQSSTDTRLGLRAPRVSPALDRFEHGTPRVKLTIIIYHANCVGSSPVSPPSPAGGGGGASVNCRISLSESSKSS